MKTSLRVIICWTFLLTSSCGLIDGELFRSAKTDLGSTDPDLNLITASDSWGFWNSSIDLVKSGQYIISGGERGLSIFDFTNPYAPTLENNILNNPVKNISKSGNTAFVSYKSGKFEVLDITDPQGPSLLSEVTLTAPRRAVVSGNYLYVPDAASGIRVLDFSDPANVTLVNTIDTNGLAESINIVGGYLYLADEWAGTKIFDLTTPSAPSLLGSLAAAGDVMDVKVQGNYAYVAVLWEGIDVVDISNKAAPTLAGTYTDSDYYENGFQTLQIIGTRLLAKEQDYGGLKSFDISNPISPQLLSQAQPGADLYTDSYNFVTDGNYAYVAFDGRGIKAVDISDFTNISLPYSLVRPAFAWYAVSVAAKGNYAYFCENYNGRFYVLDVTTPSKPVEILASPTFTCSHEMLVDGNYLYTVDDYSAGGGLAIFDISTPSIPVFVNDVTIASPRRLEKSGNYVYVVNNNNAIEIVDVSNPAAPVIANSVPGTFTDIAVDGNYVYATGPTTLTVLDISNPLSIPAATTLNVGTPTITSYRISKVGNSVFLSGGDSVVSINVTTPTAPVLSQTVEAIRTLVDFTSLGTKLYGCHEYYGIVEFDISNPAAITQSNFFDTGICRDVTIANGKIYAADQASGFKIIDLAVPLSQMRGDAYSRYAGAGLQIVGNHLFLGSGEYGVQLLNVTDPKNPAPLSSARTNNVDSFYVNNDTLFIGDDYGLFIFDISTPASPVMTSRSKKGGGNMNGFAVSGTTLYSAEGGLVVYDISSLSSPSITTTIANAADSNVKVAGNRLYVADGTDGFRIFNITTPAAPAQLGIYNSPNYAYQVLVEGSYAYIADGTTGLIVVDISNPAAPVSVGTYNTPGTAYDLVKKDQYIFVADYTGGIQIIDVSVPATPTLKSTLSTTVTHGNPRDVSIAGDYLHILNNGGSYELFDISDIDDIHQ